MYLLEILLLELGLLAVCMLLTPVPWKLIRLTMDWQYGTASNQLEMSNTRSGDEEVTIEVLSDDDDDDDGGEDGAAAKPAAVEAFVRYVSRVRRAAVITWPLVTNYSRGWVEVERRGVSGCFYTESTKRGGGSAGGVSDGVARSVKDASELEPAAASDNRRADGSARGRGGARLLFFVHGGALISGSPKKYNSYNWVTTMALFGGYDRLVMPRYSLAPESKSPRPLVDLLAVLFEYYHANDVDRVCFVGFSAGCFLLLQLLLVLEYMSAPAESRPVTHAFGLPMDDRAMHQLVPTFTTERCRSLVERIHTAQLFSGLYRTDVLYLNNRLDIGGILTEFIRVYSDDPKRDDPMLELAKARRRRATARVLDRVLIRLYDVNQNSLSNHSVQLHALLPRSHLHIFDKSWFVVDKWMLKYGNLTHKFLANAQKMRFFRAASNVLRAETEYDTRSEVPCATRSVQEPQPESQQPRIRLPHGDGTSAILQQPTANHTPTLGRSQSQPFEESRGHGAAIPIPRSSALRVSRPLTLPLESQVDESRQRRPLQSQVVEADAHDRSRVAAPLTLPQTRNEPQPVSNKDLGAGDAYGDRLGGGAADGAQDLCQEDRHRCDRHLDDGDDAQPQADTRYIQTEESMVVHAIHYHFFPFMAFTEAAQKSMLRVVKDLAVS